MKHQFTITISTPDAALAGAVRDEAVNAIQDMVDRMRPAFDIDCGSMKATGDELDTLYIAAARDEYEREGEIEIDENAVVAYGDDRGAYVAAWVWVDENATLEAAREAQEAQEARATAHLQPDDTEGGNCD